MTATSHRAPPRKRTVVKNRTGPAREHLADIQPGCEVVILTHGQFSLIDVITVLLDVTGPADVTISTWSAANADLTHAANFLRDGRIRTIRFLVDRSFQTRQPEYCATLRRLYGDDAIRTARLHAKFVTIRNDRWNLAVRTSANLNENPRLELVEVSDDPALADFLDGEVDAIFANQPAGTFNGELPPAETRTRIRMGRKVRTGV